MLLLFSYGEAEVSQLSSEREVFAVSKGHESALLEIELPLAVDVLLIGIYADYLRKEHGMGAQKL